MKIKCCQFKPRKSAKYNIKPVLGTQFGGNKATAVNRT